MSCRALATFEALLQRFGSALAIEKPQGLLVEICKLTHGALKLWDTNSDTV